LFTVFRRWFPHWEGLAVMWWQGLGEKE